MSLKPDNKIIIYQPKQGKARLEVRLEHETLWLDTHQMGKLFERDRSVIVRHISNIYRTKELSPKSTCAKNAQVAADGKIRLMDFYNLDMILSVGYRVNSRRGTQFRIWASQVLKDHLLKGYTINEKRLREENVRLKELKKTVDIMGRVIEEKPITGAEAEGLLRVIKDYSLGLSLLDDYDCGRLAIEETTGPARFLISYGEARKAIGQLAKQSGKITGNLFGREKDDSFRSSIGTIYQTFDGKELYPSIEEKAAHLLYFVVKNHSFVDGNKRIAAFLFLWFLDANGILYGKEGAKRIGDNTLVALTLMIAESKPQEKDVIVKVIVNLINRKNK